MKQIIAIEGPDNLGKTYLANYLKQELSRMSNTTTPRVVHCGPPVGEGKAALTYQLNYLKTVIHDVKFGGGIEIWDRSIIGEDVYGPLYRSGKYNHAEYSAALHDGLKSVAHRMCIIVLYTDGEVYTRLNIKAKNDEVKAYQKASEAKLIATRFVDVVAGFDIKRTLYINCANYASLDERNRYILSRVKAWVKMMPYQHIQTGSYAHTFFNASQLLWKTGEGFVDRSYHCGMYTERECKLGEDHHDVSLFGSKYDQPTAACGALTNIKYIFVGEAPGQDGCGKTGVPFYDDPSGNLMQVSLDRLGIHPVQYYMTNVVKCCPIDNRLDDYVSRATRKKLECVQHLGNEIKRVLKMNPIAIVIALGKVAAEELSRANISHRVVYHPAYYLRMGIGDEFFRSLKTVALEE